MVLDGNKETITTTYMALKYGKFFSLVKLLRVLLLCILPSMAQAQFTYITNNGTITITGKTEPLYDLIIPSIINGLPVTDIAPSAFACVFNITNVTIPNSVTSIGSSAFLGARLTNIYIPESVTNIGNDAFHLCSSLSEITVNASNVCYSSADGVLFNKDLTTIIQFPEGKGGNCILPDSLTNIGDMAFRSCSHLTSITIPNRVERIGQWAFSECTGLTSVLIPDSVTNIGYWAFNNCSSMTNITIGNGIISIKHHTFANCQSLVSIMGGERISSIEDSAFSYCYGLTSFEISHSITNIGASIFYCCTGLTNVIIGDNIFRIGDDSFYNCVNLTSITIPNSVGSIGKGVFAGCTKLESLIIPASVNDIGIRCFNGCANLVAIYFKGNFPPNMDFFMSYFSATIYYLSGTTGWDTFNWYSKVLWNPQPQPTHLNFGIRTNQFGFPITASTNLTIVVEACTNLANPDWLPLSTNTLTNAASYFSDPQWTNHRGRFYRLRSP